MNDDNDSSRQPLRMPFALRWLIARPRDSFIAVVAGLAAIAILVNALFMQTGPHPAPIFAGKLPAVAAPHPDALAVLSPRQRPSEVKGDAKADTTENARARLEIVAQIQRELARRGFYDGVADGLHGPKTDAAIREFEQAAGLRPSAEPNDKLLAAITRSNVKATPAPATRGDSIAALLAPNSRIVAVQRALTEFGYGPVKPTGSYDSDTRSAIERFERARKRPVTGQINDHLVRELTTLTGRPLE